MRPVERVPYSRGRWNRQNWQDAEKAASFDLKNRER
jgi:hypothetical protein